MKKPLIALTAAVLAGGGGLAASAVFYFWEPSGFTRSSLAYGLKVDAAIGQFPLWNPATEPLYSVGTAEGLRPHTVESSYLSELTAAQLQAKAEEQGFDCEPRQSFMFCENHNFRSYDVSIIISANENPPDTREVHITFLGGES
ncbi:MAG: hypothetical protein V4812_17450 [Pseudomonadota bacterium]